MLLTGLMVSHTQTPFICDGRVYRVLEEQGGSTFQEITIDSGSNQAVFTDRFFFGGSRINGIGYRPVDNLIYGVLLGEKYGLCRIDADFQLERLRDLPLPEELLFVSGDISPDERFLVLLGFTPDSEDNLLAVVDLSANDYPLTIIPISKTNPAARLYCADIAFHPTLNKLYGFEHSEGRLITIDLQSGLVDNTTYPILENLRGNVPSLFFDAFGNLFGIGAAENIFTNRNLYRFNVADGSVALVQEMGFERNQDACSCPFKVELLKRVSNRRAFLCTILDFEFTLLNRTDRIQTNLQISDTFPEGTLIQSISELPFTATINSGVGSRFLDLSNIDLPLGEYHFSLSLAVLETAAEQDVFNTAYLDNVILGFPSEEIRIVSDDPETPENDDPTRFEIRELNVDFAGLEPFICPGEELLLTSGVDNASFYEWSTGETGPSIIVTTPGTYSVTVQTPCDEVAGHLNLEQGLINIDIGPDRTIERGISIEWDPLIQSNAPVQFYFWSEIPDTTLTCFSCAMPISSPTRDSEYQLIAENALGCRDTSEVTIGVQGLKVYAPNVFSPNRDGLNDGFYLQSRLPYPVEEWQIFNRWGGLVYDQSNVFTNDPSVAWSGRKLNDKLQPAGLYVWQASVVALDGIKHIISGEVVLVR